MFKTGTIIRNLFERPVMPSSRKKGAPKLPEKDDEYVDVDDYVDVDEENIKV